MEKVVELRNIVKDYGSFRAVDGLNLDIYKGDVFGFLGPNGAGKSTTIRMLASLITPTSGDVYVFGRKLSTHRNEILSRTGCIVEKPDFYKHLSGRMNLRLFGMISGRKIPEVRIDEVLELTGLSGRGNDKVKAYSHGMKQRLGIAQALLHEPELIILDEPVTGLDPQGIVDVRNLIIHLSKDKKITVFLSSHLLAEIELVANRMAVLNKGKTIMQGNVKDLLNADEVVISVYCDDLIKAKKVLQEVFSLQPELQNDHLEVETKASLAAEINAGLVGNGIAVSEFLSKRRLENIYLQLTS